MAEYIDRNKLLYGLKSLRQSKAVPPDVFYVVENMRAEDVAPIKHGKLIEDKTTYCGAGRSNYKCTCCDDLVFSGKAKLKSNQIYKYCPFCGAKMTE